MLAGMHMNSLRGSNAKQSCSPEISEKRLLAEQIGSFFGKSLSLIFHFDGPDAGAPVKFLSIM